MKHRLTSNEKINQTVIIGVLLTANNAMLVAMWGKLPTEVVVALLALPGMVCSGLIGFIARDVMRGQKDQPESEEPQNPEEPK